jgi:hypothetical protein
MYKIAKLDNMCVIYKNEIFWDLGRATMISLLDMINKNPYSRIVNSPY